MGIIASMPCGACGCGPGAPTSALLSAEVDTTGNNPTNIINWVNAIDINSIGNHDGLGGLFHTDADTQPYQTLLGPVGPYLFGANPGAGTGFSGGAACGPDQAYRLYIQLTQRARFMLAGFAAFAYDTNIYLTHACTSLTAVNALDMGAWKGPDSGQFPASWFVCYALVGPENLNTTYPQPWSFPDLTTFLATLKAQFVYNAVAPGYSPTTCNTATAPYFPGPIG